MKIFIPTVLLLLSFAFVLNAQINIPKLSPLEKIETNIGMVGVELIYSRPSMRNRVIFGELVPFDKIWRTGANRNNKITFSGDVLIGSLRLPAGSYSIFSKPSTESWEIYFHKESDEYGISDSIDFQNVVITFIAKPMHIEDEVETFSLAFKNHTSNSAVLNLSWENTQIEIPISTNSDDIIQAQLYQMFVDQAGSYESASWIYFDKEHDYAKALNAINKCIAIMESEIPFEKWVAEESNLRNPNRPRRYLTKAEILAKLNRKPEAIVEAKKSLEIAYKIESEYYINKCLAYIEKWRTE